MREIVFDTETTGLEPGQGHRLVEIGCVELVNRVPTGRTFHRYVNPDRDVPAQAFAVHGLSRDFLSKHPRFYEIAGELAAFLGAEAALVAHNAAFDLAFLNAELKRAGKATISQARLIDTLALARRKHPGGQHSLDRLCTRYGVDASRRAKHGALLDAELLAEVYVALAGGRQMRLFEAPGESAATAAPAGPASQRPVPLPPRVTDQERAAHAAMVEGLGEKAIWLEYRREDLQLTA
jgi:DNA polymerase-3 subunit epsilon